MTLDPTLIPNFYKNKTLFVTGATGFLGKVLLEKLLRSLPNIKQIYVLVRTKPGITIQERLNNEVFKSKIFDRMINDNFDKNMDNFLRYVHSKVTPIAGDMLGHRNNLDIVPSDIDQIVKNGGIDIVFHSAATVDFTERIDIAIDINVLGPLRLLTMAKNIFNVKCFVQVSSTYSSSNQPSGRKVYEKIYPLEFDPHALIQSVQGGKSEIELANITNRALGTYPNTYCLTKHISEVLMVLKRKELQIPLHIVRPSIIGAALREPWPGWIDSRFAAGAVLMAGGLGLLTVMPGINRSVGDIIPVDTVVNHMIHAGMETYDKNPRLKADISNCGTSYQNPCNWRQVQMAFGHFRDYPSPNASGPPTFSMIDSPQRFQIEWFLRYTLPSSAYRTFAELIRDPGHIKTSKRLARGVEQARTVNITFEFFTRNQWFFKNEMAQSWVKDAKDAYGIEPNTIWIDKNPFNVDITDINWKQYYTNFAIGLRAINLKEDLVLPSESSIQHNAMSLTTDRIYNWDDDHHVISFPSIMPDITWSYTHGRAPGYTKKGIFGRILGLTGWKEGKAQEAKFVPRLNQRKPSEMLKLVLSSKQVQDAMVTYSKTRNVPQKAAEQHGYNILKEMAAQMDVEKARVLTYPLRKVWRTVYEGIRVDEKGLEKVRNLAAKGECPLVLLPSHRSYVDFIILSYIFFAYNLPLPHILAGEDFLGLGVLSTMLRHAGAFFIKRPFPNDVVYQAIFNEYIQRLLEDKQVVEFFLEGTRSRTGKTLTPKFGALKTSIAAAVDGRVKDVMFVPVSIDFERTWEASLYSDEMLGKRKPGETLPNLLKSIPTFLKSNYGFLSIQFGEPVSFNDYEKQHVESFRKKSAYGASYNPRTNDNDFKKLTSSLAYDLLEKITQSGVSMPTHLCAAIILNYRSGIKKPQLLEDIEWLRHEVTQRGGQVILVEGTPRNYSVERSIKMLGDLVVERRHEFYVPNTETPDVYKNYISLGLYRNKILHLFSQEALWAIAFYASVNDIWDKKANNDSDVSDTTANNMVKMTDAFLPIHDLLKHVLFLDKILSLEFVRDRSNSGDDQEREKDHMDVLFKMIDNGTFNLKNGFNDAFPSNSKNDFSGSTGIVMTSTYSSNDNRPTTFVNDLKKHGSISINNEGERMFGFLCSIMWPFIDAYYTSSLSLNALLPSIKMESKPLIERAQWLTETMYNDGHIDHYEACASNTISNAIASFQSLNVLTKFVDEETNTKSDFLQLHDAYNDEDGLLEFVARINFFRKPSSAGNGGKGKVIPSIANFPMLAKQTTNSKL
jgi:1-acyl-sn-glycerol-3-phosphate acyltransferase